VCREFVSEALKAVVELAVAVVVKIDEFGLIIFDDVELVFAAVVSLSIRVYSVVILMSVVFGVALVVRDVELV